MLEFFRRYQKGFFIVITAVIVFSFAFFGTFTLFSRHEGKDTVAFIAVDGSKVYQSEVNDVIKVISSDGYDSIYSITGDGNPFNNSYIATDVLEWGIIDGIIEPYLSTLRDDLTVRLEKEKRFQPYVNPQAPFISAENVWIYYAPEVKKWYDSLRSMQDAASVDAFNARRRLYIANRKFPGAYVKQMIRHQEKQLEWLQPDEDLVYKDLSIFGYNTLEDWFGKHFLEFIAKYVINAAKYAESKGFTYAEAEVWQELVEYSEKTFREDRRMQARFNGNFSEYFKFHMQRLHMDKARLMHAWRYVAVCRTIFDDNSDYIILSTLPFKSYLNYMNEFVKVDIYKLPQDLAFQNLQDLEKFQIYVNAVSDPREKRASALMLPQQFLSAQEIGRHYPELVQKRYKLAYAVVNKDEVTSKLGVRKTWEWEVTDSNWPLLQKQFPVLADTVASTSEARLAILDSIDSKMREQVDHFARQKMLQEHPEWLDEAFNKAPVKEEEVFIREQGGNFPLQGIKNRTELMRILDAVTLVVAHPTLQAYTQDGTQYYKITVVERASNPEVLTFKQAVSDGTLNNILNRLLEAAYMNYRAKTPSTFLQADGSWKSFAEARDIVARTYFADLYMQLSVEAEKAEKQLPHFTDWEDEKKALVACRMLPYMQMVWQDIKNNPAAATKWIYKPAPEVSNPLAQQWKLINSTEQLTRRDEAFPIDPLEVMSLKPDVFSKLRYVNPTGICFFKVLDKGVVSIDKAEREYVYDGRYIIGYDVYREIARVLLRIMQEKNALVING